MSTFMGRRPRRRLEANNTASRKLLSKAFAVFALFATLFGLAMLVVFFLLLAHDVREWFRVMPALVQERNQELLARVERGRDIEKERAGKIEEIDRDLQQELSEAANDAERTKIRQDFTRFHERAMADLESTRQEMLQAQADIRPNTSALSLLGHFFLSGPSHQAEDAGILPALLGSLLLALITILAALPLGVGAAIYLEEYRHSNWLASVIQLNINNLAGVPSVMYGILGAYVFVELIFRPMESPMIAARNALGGGLTLAILTLPVIIVSAQEAIRAVPSSLRHAALALGATQWQTVSRIVLPSALPGILTGMILALCRAIGEAAPLVLFGALLYVNQLPTLFSRFTVLPMQIFGWSERAQIEFRYNAALASAILVLGLLLLNGAAIYLRQRAQRNTRW